jgi:hypothetical protein
MKTVSGFWDVPDNPKPSYQQGHIQSVKWDQTDLFLTEHNFPYEHLPAHQILTDKTPRNPEYLKFGRQISATALKRLTPILTSKILLLKHLAELYPAEDYYMWIDCVNTENLAEISNTESDKILCSQYTGDRWERQNITLYGDIPNPYQTWLLAQVIKVPAHRLDKLCDAYVEAVKYVDSRYPVTDAEFPLARVYDQHPDWFEIINRP